MTAPDFWQQQELRREVLGGDDGGPQNTPMLVAVRTRPLWRSESERGELEIIRVLEERVVLVLDPHEYDQALQPNRTKEKKYAFDCVFDESASQEQVFRGTTRGLIDGVLQGYNASVFAYGATGAGKTYTMLGALDSPGVMVLTLNDMYRRMRTDPQFLECEFKVRLSYMEIYNEVIKDLLNPTDSSIGLPLNEDPVRGMVVAGITEYDATSASEILGLLTQGNMARAQEPTAANKTSSRSHAILQVTIEQQEKTANFVGAVKCGKLSLIDLAGSERASKTENTGMRLKEGANINRSLLALGNCINALADGRSHVPYRDSKMTRLLKDSLGGNCRTVMIANISPASTQFEETLNSLKYANRAKNLKTKVSSNVATVSAHIADYQRIILSLRSEIAQLKASAQQHGGGLGLPLPLQLVGPHTPLDAGRERERVAFEQAEAGERQQARALQQAIVQVCADRRKLTQQLDSVHGQLINQAASALAAGDAAAPPDAGLSIAVQAVTARLAQNEQLALQLLQAVPERIASAERAQALQTLFQAQFLELARAHASYELTVRQSYEDAVASSTELPPRVQRAVGRLQEWRRLRAGTHPHRQFDERMARAELQLGGGGFAGGGSGLGSSTYTSHEASAELLLPALALRLLSPAPSTGSLGRGGGGARSSHQSHVSLLPPSSLLGVYPLSGDAMPATAPSPRRLLVGQQQPSGPRRLGAPVRRRSLSHGGLQLQPQPPSAPPELHSPHSHRLPRRQPQQLLVHEANGSLGGSRVGSASQLQPAAHRRSIAAQPRVLGQAAAR
ncbi:P-loop containing nucleoside triphosphate hydrolase protein [Pavlovales sp. CCMP2436]|nr:P-loop containing nucleoside triphosphate hydrolase protein [Pavlovales sp. CCMP2436]